MGFAYYRLLSFDRTKCGSTSLSNFPVLVSIVDATFGSHVQNASGYDIVFSSDLAGLSLVPWEVESFNKATGTLVAWVKIPTVNGSGAGSNSTIYLCYGNAGISTAQNTGSFSPANVWSNGFKGVWHLNSVTGGAGSVTDSTGVNNGSPVNSPTNTAGKVGGGAAMVTASSQYVNCGNNASLKSTTFTLSCWFQVTVDGALCGLIGDMADASRGGAALSFRGAFAPSDRQPYLAMFNGATESDCFGTTGTMPINTWFYSVGTYDGTTMRIYRNGAQEASPTAVSGGIATNTLNFALGSLLNFAPGYYLGGKLDECRMANVARAADWILTEYNNQNAPGNIGANNFVIFGAESLTPGAAAQPQPFVIA